MDEIEAGKDTCLISVSSHLDGKKSPSRPA